MIYQGLKLINPLFLFTYIQGVYLFMKKILIHDLPHELSEELFSSFKEDFLIIDANAKAASCIGCFNCWLKEPGLCKFRDKLETVGQLILSSERLIIVSEMLYGGLSVPVKRIIDRSIPGITPFFKKKFGKLHHLERYKTQTDATVIFYNTEDATPEELTQSKEYVKAMCINYHARTHEVQHLKTTDFSEVNL